MRHLIKDEGIGCRNRRINQYGAPIIAPMPSFGDVSSTRAPSPLAYFLPRVDKDGARFGHRFTELIS